MTRIVTVQRDLYTDRTSDVTSQVYWVGDALEQTLQVTNSGSTTTVQVSNAEGRQSAIAEADWSTVTTNINGGMMNIEPGHRWLRCLQVVASGSRGALLGLQNNV